MSLFMYPFLVFGALIVFAAFFVVKQIYLESRESWRVEGAASARMIVTAEATSQRV